MSNVSPHFLGANGNQTDQPLGSTHINCSWQALDDEPPELMMKITLPKTNSLPLKIGRAPKGNSYSNHQFSGANC